MPRRFDRVLALAGVAWAASALPVAAQPYPQRPLRLVVPFSVGGASDTAARIVSQHLAPRLGQPIVIDNRPQGSGAIGVDVVVRSAADGHTLLMASNAELAILPHLNPKLPFDTLRDLVPISLVAVTPLLAVVHPALAVRSVGDLVAWAKAKPDELLYASSGNGGAVHLATELFIAMTGARMRHVPFQGGAPGLAATIAGDTQVMFVVMPLGLPQARAGKVRALAVSTAKRVAIAADLPTIAEAGVPGYEMSVWNGLMAPRGTPPAALDRLHRTTVEVVALPEVRDAFARVGAEAASSTPGAFAQRVRDDHARFGRVVREAGVRAE